MLVFNPHVQIDEVFAIFLILTGNTPPRGKGITTEVESPILAPEPLDVPGFANPASQQIMQIGKA
jgi:hypothetical protein